MRQAKRQREVAQSLEKLGAIVERDETSAPQWLQRLLGEDFFWSIQKVHFWFPFGGKIPDGAWEFLDRLDQLKELYISGQDFDEADEAAVQHLAVLTRLERLEIIGGKVAQPTQDAIRKALPHCSIEIHSL